MNETTELHEMRALAYDLYVMLRDSTPGPLTDDMPVTPLLRRAQAILGDAYVEDEAPVMPCPVNIKTKQ